jgi:hypothetical protein
VPPRLQARQTLDQLLHGLTAVRNPVLGFGIEFGAGLAEFRQVEHRVIAEAAFAAQFGQDLAVPLAFGDQRLRVVGVADEDDDRDEMGGAVGVGAELGKQFFIVALVRFRLAGVTGGINARRAAERRDADARIIGQRRQARKFGCMPRLGQGVLECLGSCFFVS